MNDLVIVGTGGFAREVHQVIEDINDDDRSFNVLGFLDDDPAKHGTEVHGLEILGDVEWLASRPQVAVAVGLGATPARRRAVQRILTDTPHPFPVLVHPLAWVGNRIEIGEGTVVCAGNLLTTDLRVGRYVILNLDCTVGHDTVVEDFVTVAPSVNISGTVHVGEGTDLGTGATIIQGLAIGAWSVVGAGAVVVEGLPANVTAVGIPAKVIKERLPGWHEAP